MELFDTHCHIQSAGLSEGERATRELWARAEDASIDNVIDSAYAAGVTRMMCVGCDVTDSALAVKTVKTRENLYASIGIHPHEAQKYVDDSVALDQFAALALESKVVAVGECGLDFFYTHSPKAAQLEILEFQLQLAQKHDLPLIFHVREAFADFWPIFEKYQSAGHRMHGVLHSFTDSVENMEKAIQSGLYIGVNGIATFTKNEDQLAMYRAIPAEKLLLETDAPFLTPVPFRGKVCEPKHLVLTAEFLANLRGVSATELATISTQNARKLFKV